MQPEGLGTKFSELINGKDIDFKEYPEFSRKYYLHGQSEPVIRDFFNNRIIRFLESREGIHIECHKKRLLLYKKLDLLDTTEIEFLEKFAEDFVQEVRESIEQPVG